jgi:hypothetical protein
MVTCARRFIPDKEPRYPLASEVDSRPGRSEMTKMKFSLCTDFPARNVTTKLTDVTKIIKWILNVKIVVDGICKKKKYFIYYKMSSFSAV